MFSNAFQAASGTTKFLKQRGVNPRNNAGSTDGNYNSAQATQGRIYRGSRRPSNSSEEQKVAPDPPAESSPIASPLYMHSTENVTDDPSYNPGIPQYVHEYHNLHDLPEYKNQVFGSTDCPQGVLVTTRQQQQENTTRVSSVARLPDSTSRSFSDTSSLYSRQEVREKHSQLSSQEQSNLSGSNNSQATPLVPVAAQVFVVHDDTAELLHLASEQPAEDESSFVFEASNNLVEELKTAESLEERVEALQEIYSFVRDNNPDAFENAKDILADDGVSSIVAAMKAHLNDPKIQELGCACLRSLAWSDHVSVPKVLSCVLRAMQAFPKRLTIQHQACGTLQALTESNTICALVVKAGGHAAIFEAMRRHRESHEVQIVGCAALANLAQTNAPLLLQKGAEVKVIRAMQHHKDVLAVVELAFKVLQSLAECETDDSKSRMVRSGVMTAIEEVLDQYQSNTELQSVGKAITDKLQ